MPDRELVRTVQKCVKHGDFTFTSGRRSNWFCDIVAAHHSFDIFLDRMHIKHAVVGILTGGGLMAMRYNLSGVVDLRNGTLYPPYGRWKIPLEPLPENLKKITILDDVVTTERAMKQADQIITDYGLVVEERWVVLDRRREEDKTLEVSSLVTAADLDLEA